MKLRSRLVVISLAITLPTIFGLYWVDARARHVAAERLLARVTITQLSEPGVRARCEADPAAWGGEPMPPPGMRPGPPLDRHHGPRSEHDPDEPHGAPPRLFAYDEQLHAEHPDAPTLAPELLADLDAADSWTSLGSASLDDDVLVLVQTPWRAGPCALVLAHGTTTAGWLGAILPAQPLWLLPVLAVFLGLLIGAGPIVRRIRKLAALVERSAKREFAEPTVLEGNDEIAELSRAFQAAAATVRTQLDELARRERTLREFVANTTHDVLTPLTVLADHLTSLDERHVAPELVAAAMHEVQYMTAIVENLALAAKLDAASPVVLRERVDLGAVVERVVARHRTIARKREVELVHALPEQPLIAIGDLTMLEQALGNLVHNAVRYNEPGGHVAVVLEAAAGGFVLRVLDDGPGIDAADLDRLVARGARGDEARTREPSGQGLGLAIAFRVAQLHGFALTLGRADEGGLRVELAGPTVAAQSTLGPTRR